MTFPRFAYTVTALNLDWDRASFSCGIDALDRYFRQQAGQEVRRYVAAVFVLRDQVQERIAGYYTLAATSVKVSEFPPEITKKLPRYPLLPATLLGRFAIDTRYQGQGLGSFLLMDALQRCLLSEIASVAVVVEAKDAQAEAFYQHHEFIPFPDQLLRLYLPMATIAKLFPQQ